MPKLTDQDKKNIIADYVECQSYREVARGFNISPNTVKNLVLCNQDIAQKCTQKKEKNTLDILAHMDKQKDKVCSLIDIYLKALSNKDKIDKATVNQLSTALGTVIDKFTMPKVIEDKSAEDKNTVVINFGEAHNDEN